MIKLNDESLKTVVGGEGYFPRARTAATVVALPGAGMGACAGIIIGSLNGFASSKIYAEQTRMGFIKKTVTIAPRIHRRRNRRSISRRSFRRSAWCRIRNERGYNS